MSPPDENLDAALHGLGPDELDGLTPDQVARLEGVLNRHPMIASRFADALPAADPALQHALAALDGVTQPSVQAWDAVWSRIEVGLPVAVAPPSRSLVPQIVRFWRPFAAVAASLLLARVWLWTNPRPAVQPAAAPWPIEIAQSVDFDQIEVSPGHTPVLVSTDPDSGPDVIWVMEDEG